MPAVVVAFLISISACDGGSSTSPSRPAALAARGEPFEVTGVVTDDTGRPLQGIAVIMRYWLGGVIQHQDVMTDAAGAYRIAFTSNPWSGGTSSHRGAARAELIANGYEWYYRTVFATGPQLVENFRLHPLQRIAPGESAVLVVAPDDGICAMGLSWTLAAVCRSVSVTAHANGTMTVEAISQGNAGQPLVSVCCASGDDRGGNPVTLPVTAGTEYTVEVGLLDVMTTTQSILVRTSFDR